MYVAAKVLIYMYIINSYLSYMDTHAYYVSNINILELSLISKGYSYYLFKHLA